MMKITVKAQMARRLSQRGWWKNRNHIIIIIIITNNVADKKNGWSSLLKRRKIAMWICYLPRYHAPQMLFNRSMKNIIVDIYVDDGNQLEKFSL